VEVTKTLDEERETVAALRAEMEKLAAKLSESEKVHRNTALRKPGTRNPTNSKY
jgi:hypothetical protein